MTKRRFDWDKAVRFRELGMTYDEIAKRLGVSSLSIRYACDPEFRDKAKQRDRNRRRS